MAEYIREEKIEAYLVQRVEALGGLCEKFKSPARKNVPDRIVSMPGGVIVFVELKSPNKPPRAGQLRDHKRRRDRGFRVEVIDTYEGVDHFIEML